MPFEVKRLRRPLVSFQPLPVRNYLFLFFWSCIAVAGIESQAQQRMVELEIWSDARSVIGIQQRWMELLHQVGADRVVVKTGPVRAPEVEEIQLSSSTLITVTGSIDGDKLLLPGGKYSIRNKQAIRNFIQQLREDGAKVALAEKKAFGLTSEQLVSLHEELSKTLDFETRDRPAREIIDRIEQTIGRSFRFDSTAISTLRRKGMVADELQGISCGTALAMVLRPLGLVLSPRREQGSELELRIVDYREAEENWPIGWPINDPPVMAEPRLFERLELEIRGFPLQDALNAIEKRTGVPFFYDQNSFARQEVDTSKMKVTLVQKKVSFMVAVDKLLRQGKPKLKSELRQDENGKKFLWITTW